MPGYFTYFPNINIQTYPGCDPNFQPHPNSENTTGDVHANIFRMLHFLVQTGAMSLTENQWNTLLTIYEEHKPLLKKAVDPNNKDARESIKNDIRESLERFYSVLSEASYSKHCLSRFLGDELSDRDSLGNDYFVLLLFKAMHEKGAKYEVIESNHSRDFKAAFAAARHEKAPGECAERYAGRKVNLSTKNTYEFRASSYNFAAMIDLGIVSQATINSIVEKAYLPYNKLVSYTLDLPDIYLYSHAPVGLETIQNMANYLGLQYHENSAQTLAKTIDDINEIYKLSVCYNLDSWLTEWWKDYEKIPLSILDSDAPCIPSNLPFVRSLLNRKSDERWPIDLGIGRLPFKVTVVHGHVGPGHFPGFKKEWNVQMRNLDSYLGKTPAHNDGSCTIFQHLPAPALQNEVELSPPSPNDSDAKQNDLTAIFEALLNKRPQRKHSETDLEEKQINLELAYNTMTISLSEWNESTHNDPNLTAFNRAVQAFNSEPQNRARTLLEITDALSKLDPSKLGSSKDDLEHLSKVICHTAVKAHELLELTGKQKTPTESPQPAVTLLSFFKPKTPSKTQADNKNQPPKFVRD